MNNPNYGVLAAANELAQLVQDKTEILCNLVAARADELGQARLAAEIIEAIALQRKLLKQQKGARRNDQRTENKA